MIGMLGKKALAVLAIATLVVAASTTAAVLEAYWLAIGGLGVLQVAVLALLLRPSRPASSAEGLDVLSARIMAAVETERLDAIDRHREVLEALGRGVTPANER
ncbi:MAG: hypothetical protein ACRDQ7_02165 [Haloechinothrix sp.]